MSAKPWYAISAKNLLAAREKGMKPDGPVIVSTMDDFRSSEWMLGVQPDMPVDRLDWRMLANLEVWLWGDGATPIERLLSLADGIARKRPRRLCLRFDRKQETHDVDLGAGYHTPAVLELPALHVFHWEPMPLNFTSIERRLTTAALAKHARGTVL